MLSVGADITDYFNYGFNEDSWKLYCSKQNRLRAENGLSVPKFVSLSFIYIKGVVNPSLA